MKKKTAKSRPDFPTEFFTGQPHLELYGCSQCVVDGLKSVSEYTDEKIKLNIGKKSVTFHGSGLHIDSFTPQGAVVEGLIVSLDFSDAD